MIFGVLLSGPSSWALLASLIGCLSGACASNAPDPSSIHADPAAQRAWQQWLEAGQPTLGAGQHALRGKASWYGPGLHGNRTASGEAFDMYGMTAAHRSLPFGTIVLVRRPDTAQEVVVRINDRGPFIEGRIIDLSYGAAHDLDLLRKGVVEVQLTVLHLPPSS
ncbi:MAG: septal ring lytic transglycosylase RlpA family protein [Myxococcota bacterium]|jgi:rare lipoprotein A|nr:septal ring lytic transglycosylase RlpA family protein [Myxococcota bacterium]